MKFAHEHVDEGARGRDVGRWIAATWVCAACGAGRHPGPRHLSMLTITVHVDVLAGRGGRVDAGGSAFLQQFSSTTVVR